MGGMTGAIAHLGLLDDDEILLDIAALELSALDHEGVDLDPYLAILEAMEERLAELGDAASDGLEQATVLAHVIGGDYGFVGDTSGYDAPVNADMIRVIDRRKGLPVSLSILYVALARRLGWEADALNTPGHVLVSIGPPETRKLIDPFHRGAIVTPERVAALLTRALGPGAFPSAEHLAPMSNRTVLARLLLNQATRADEAGDAARAMAVYRRITIVAPDMARSWWELARLQLAGGEIADARASLSAMLEITRDADQRSQILATLDAISER
jgi:regulator of sirC expression with transglutaminase-like and TPR domain